MNRFFQVVQNIFVYGLENAGASTLPRMGSRSIGEVIAAGEIAG